MEPVGMVAVVSIKTIWNRKRVNNRGIIAHPERKNPVVPKSPKSFPKRLMVNSLVSSAVPPAEGSGADAAHLKGKAADPVTEHSEAIDHEVHSHGVPGILGLGETGLNHGKTGLHKHNQEAGK